MTEQLDFSDDYAPRYGATPTPIGRLAERLEQILRSIYELQRGSQLRNASISGGDGLRILDDDGTLQAQIKPDRTVTVFDQSGSPVVRMGQMLNTGPETYGIEVKIGATWVQLGSQSVTWSNVSGKPSTFPPSGHSHAGGDITSAVANASNATTAGTSNLTLGSSRAFNNTVAGSTFYAVWVGNDGGFSLGRNTSSMKYKQNFRPVESDPLRILNIEEVIFDRKDSFEPPAGEGAIGPERRRPGARDEYGVLAEQVAAHMPELIQYFDGEIDGVRYEMIGLALVPVVRMHEGRLDALEQRMDAYEKKQADLERRVVALENKSTTPVTPVTPNPKGNS